MNTEILEANAVSHKSVKNHILCWLNEFEEIFTTLASRLGPWIAPISPAYFVARAAVAHLHTNIYIAYLMAIALEFVGVSAIHMCLRSWIWNQTRRKTDPKAPLWLGICLASLYFFATITLTVIVEVIAQAVTFAPMIFVILTGVGYVSMALNWRIGQWEQERKAEQVQRQQVKAEAFTSVKAARQQLAALQAEIDGLRQKKVSLETDHNRHTDTRNPGTGGTKSSTDDDQGDAHPVDTGVSTKQQAYDILLDVYGSGTDISGSELGRQLGKSTGLGRRLKKELLPHILPQLEPSTVNGNGHSNGKDHS